MQAKRRWLAVGAALAAVVGGAVVVQAVTGADSDDDPARSATTTLTAGDAEAASAQLSRRIRRELAGEVRTIGIPWPAEAEPRLILGARHSPTSVEVVDQRTGERTPLPTVWEGHSLSVSSVGLTERAVWVSWVHHVHGEQRPAALRYDVTTGRHELVQAPTVPHHPRANFTSALKPGDDGRFYFRTYRPGHDGPSKFTQLWSFAPGSPDDVRPEGDAQQWTVEGSLLTTLAYDDGGDPVVLRVRDLATDVEHTRTLEDCAEPHVETSTTLVVVACRDKPDVLVLDATATTIARLRVPDGVNPGGYGPPSLHVGERWLSLGRLAYHPATGRLVLLRD